MRVLVITGLYPPYFVGGAELSCQNHVVELQKRGHQVTVLTSCWGISRPIVDGKIYRWLKYDRASLEPMHRTARRDPLRLRRRRDQITRAFFLSKNYQIARSVIAAFRPDVAYVWQMECTSLSPLAAAQDLRVPIVIRTPDYVLAHLRADICLELNPLKRWYRSTIAGLSRVEGLNTSYIIPTSQVMLQSYIAAGFPTSHMQVIPQGVRSELLINTSELSNLVYKHGCEVNLLFVGRIVHEKAPDTAIQTLAHLVQDPATSHARLDLIGSGSRDYVSELKDMVHSLGLESRVTFVGKIDRQDLLERYEQYHALLFTSRWVEPFGVTVLEAMARGVPVIATRQGGPAEIISDGVNGLLVPPDEPLMFAQSVKRLVQEPDLAQKIRFTALETVREKYTNERVVDQVEEYLENALAWSHNPS